MDFPLALIVDQILPQRRRFFDKLQADEIMEKLRSPSVMVRLVVENSTGPVNLLQQENPHHLVSEGHPGK